jgi:hypothetical protein
MAFVLDGFGFIDTRSFRRHVATVVLNRGLLYIPQLRMCGQVSRTDRGEWQLTFRNGYVTATCF